MKKRITDWQALSRKDAESEVQSWRDVPQNEFDTVIKAWETDVPNQLNENYRQLRTDLLDAFNRTVEDIDAEKTVRGRQYRIDLEFGMQLYQIMNQYGMTSRIASYDPVWVYIAVRVIPDIVDRRWHSRARTGTSSGVQPDRYYAVVRRIYPKTLWWYIHLSLQSKADGSPDLDVTYDILLRNSTDEIVQLVERSGPAGYRVDVYRALMRHYGTHRDQYDAHALRRAMVLNTARARLVEPELAVGGIEGYVADLFEGLYE